MTAVISTPYATSAARWRAVATRDRAADGVFLYAVRSTGIYCRPSCPARRPRPDRVAYFEQANEAEAAGFRACLRCQPREVPVDVALVERATAIIERDDEVPTLATVAGQLDVPARRLDRAMRRVLGLSLRQFAQARRMERFRTAAATGDATTGLHEAGFGSSSRLYEQARDELGMTPGTYARGGAGMDIRYCIADSSLGRLLVGATASGVCAVVLADDDAALEAFIAAEYPAAACQRDDTLTAWVEQVLASLTGTPPASLPLDVRATAFRRRVWLELQRIPRGETRTYAEVAAAIGQPAAARAVASACAANPVALVIPCHRVVRSDGAMGGYRWGIERKAALLARERNP